MSGFFDLATGFKGQIRPFEAIHMLTRFCGLDPLKRHSRGDFEGS